MTLALAMQRPNPDAMLQEMQPAHFKEWLAYYERNPWGDIRADTRSALLAVQIGSALQNVEAINVAALFPYPRNEADDAGEDDDSNVITGQELAARYQNRHLKG